jgi:type I restriction enzyme S subunit
MSFETIQEGDWGWRKLGDIAHLNYGKGLRSDQRISGRIPVYSSAGLTGYHNQPLVNEPGIIVGRKGTVGSVHISEEPFYCIDTAYYIRKSEVQCDFKFLYYLLKTLGLEKMNQDSAVPGLNRNHAHSLSVSIPNDIAEQKRIASILSAFDAKIELNRQTNATLEAIAQAIFKEWFVDFNYPGATGELVESPLGPIPKGWQVGILGDLVNISSGKGLSKKQFKEEGYPILGANGRIGFTDNYLCNEEVILTGRVGTLGTFQLVHTEVWISDNVLIMKPSKRENYYFTYFWIKTVDFQSLNRGSTQPLVTKTDLLNLQVLIPSSEELSSFDCISRSLFNTLSNNNQQTATLSEIRDAILPKLMSGEIEV